MGISFEWNVSANFAVVVVDRRRRRCWLLLFIIIACQVYFVQLNNNEYDKHADTNNSFVHASHKKIKIKSFHCALGLGPRF